MFEIVFLVVLSIYFLISAYLITGIQKQTRISRIPTDKEQARINTNKEQLRVNTDKTKIDTDKKLTDILNVSVVIAVRNEERNLPDCIAALDKLQYPDNKIEIIFADDGSNDSTVEIIKNHKGRRDFKLIHVTEPKGNLKGKVNALAQGIEAAAGEIILLTDADCIVNPLWVYKTTSYYTANTGMVNGFTSQLCTGPFACMQSIDFIYLISVASGMANNGHPVSCIGNNMSFLKQAYKEAGGYENIPFSVTEDFALLNAIAALKKYRIIYPPDPDTLVISKPCKSWNELLRQKKRWAVGGQKASTAGKIIMAEAFFVNLCVLLTPLFFTPVSLYLAVFKISIDGFFLFPVHRRLGLQKNLKYFIAFEFYYLIYVIVLPFILLFSRKVIWKGREY